MTILFIDSGQYLDTTYLRKRWSAGDPIVDTGVKRHGTRSISCSLGYDSGFWFTQDNAVYLGASFYIDTALTTHNWYDSLIGLGYGVSGLHCHFQVSQTGQIVAYANWSSTPIQTSGVVVAAYAWHYAEIYCYSHASAGEVRIWIDDSLVIEQTGIDTVYGTQGNRFACFGSHGGHFASNFQDIYVATTRQGPCKASAYDVDSDETYTDWSPLGAGSHYVEVDDATPDGDTSYNEGDAVGEQDSYGVTAESLDTIKAVQVRSIAKRSGDITIGKFKHFVRQGSSDYLGSTNHSVLGAYGTFVDIWETDPNDSNPWTQAKIESAEFGLEVTQLGTTTTTT